MGQRTIVRRVEVRVGLGGEETLWVTRAKWVKEDTAEAWLAPRVDTDRV